MFVTPEEPEWIKSDVPLHPTPLPPAHSASTSNVAKLEEMERLLREAQAEKRSLLEHKVPESSQSRSNRFQVQERPFTFRSSWGSR